MQKVTCVHAKSVPIVKIWDPELQMACDLNVNNHVAIKNTTLVRTYMEIDSRVRTLAMIIKFWTKQRIINEGICWDVHEALTLVADPGQPLVEPSAHTRGLCSLFSFSKIEKRPYFLSLEYETREVSQRTILKTRCDRTSDLVRTTRNPSDICFSISFDIMVTSLTTSQP